MITKTGHFLCRNGLPALTAILCLVLVDSAIAAVTIQEFTGIARNREGQIEYTEKHLITYQGNTVVSSLTTYFDPKNEHIGDLNSDYAAGYQFGSYDFSDIRGGLKNGAKVKDHTVQMYTKKDPASAVRTKEIPRVSNQIVGQGFHHFIINNLQTIADGIIVHVRMVLPSKLDDFRFRIRKQNIEDHVMTIRLEIDNWFLRLFAPYIETDYDLQTKRLLRYKGVSNLKDASGRYKAVTIEYRYDA
jgi:hypothetical protein